MLRATGPRTIRLFSTFAARFSDFVSLKKLTCGKSIRKVKVKPKDFSGCQLSSTRREPNEGMCHPKSNRGVSKVVLANDTRKILSNISASLYEHFSASDFAIRKSRCSSSFVAGQGIFFVCFHVFFSMSFQENFIPSLHILCIFFPVSSFEIVFSSVVILKEFSSGTFPPRIFFFQFSH